VLKLYTKILQYNPSIPEAFFAMAKYVSDDGFVSMTASKAGSAIKYLISFGLLLAFGSLLSCISARLHASNSVSSNLVVCGRPLPDFSSIKFVLNLALAFNETDSQLFH